MSALTLLVLVSLSLILIIAYPPLRRLARRRQLSDQPLPADWTRLLQRRWRLYSHLSSAAHARIAQRLQWLMDETRFYGCAGMTVTEDMKVLILAQASLVYQPDSLESPPVVLLYPSAYVRDDEHVDEAGVVTRERHVMLGESWEQGKVVLSWDDIAQDLTSLDGHNLVIHEYAHQVDGQNGIIDGVPPLADEARREQWIAVMSEAYHRLCDTLERGEEPLIDPYAATAPEEFFAVASEMFFTAPATLESAFPAVYAQLGGLYKDSL